MGLANILMKGCDAFALNNLIHCFQLLSGFGEDNNKAKEMGFPEPSFENQGGSKPQVWGGVGKAT